MKTFRPRFLMVAGLAGVAGLLTNVNCGGGGGGGTGGTTGSGGTTSTGGKGGTGTGGSSTGGKGGSTGTGGTGSGGATGGTGGAGGKGGAGGAGTGGTAGTGAGGSAGGANGGNGGAKGGNGGSNTDGGTQNAALAYLFPTTPGTLEGFALDNYNGAGNLVNLDGGTKPTLGFDSAVGHPDAGSAKVQATFTDYNQFVLSTINIAPLIDATGKTISAWVMLDPVDGGSTFTGYAQMQINTTTGYHSASSAGKGLTAGTWTQLSIDLTQQAAPFDASQIIQVSVKFATGAKGDSGAFPGPEHCTFHFDTITDGSGGAAPPAVDVNFDHSSQGFAVGAFGSVPDGGAGATLTWDSAAGHPNPGSLDVALPFSAYGQGYAVNSGVSPPANLGGKTIHAWVMLDKTDAGESAFVQTGYVKVYAQGTGYKYASGAAKGLTAGTWTEFTMNVTTPEGGTPTTGYDPTQIIQVGIQFGTGGMPDGGVFGARETPTFHIDSIIAQ